MKELEEQREEERLQQKLEAERIKQEEERKRQQQEEAKVLQSELDSRRELMGAELGRGVWTAGGTALGAPSILEIQQQEAKHVELMVRFLYMYCMYIVLI